MIVAKSIRSGERHWQQAWNPSDSRDATNIHAIRALPFLPDLDWPVDLFASAVVDDSESDTKPSRNAPARPPRHELPGNYVGPVIWSCQPALARTPAGVAP